MEPEGTVLDLGISYSPVLSRQTIDLPGLELRAAEYS